MIKNICRAAAGGCLLVAAVTQSACTREDFDWLTATPINVTAASQPPTRTGGNVQSVSFDSGAELNAYYNITGGDVIAKEPIILTASAAGSDNKNALTPDVQPYYPQEGTVDIMALYPKERATKSITGFTVETDQREEANYKLSDLMWAGVTAQAKTTADVNLSFSHLMAKMKVKATGTGGVNVKSVSLQGIYPTVAVTSLTAAKYTLGALSGTQGEILLASTTDETINNSISGAALFPGQTIGGNLVKVATQYGDAYFSITDKEFKGGYEYSADLTVTRQHIGFITTITNWTNNGASIAVPPGSSAGLKIEVIPPQPYTGSPITPDLTITYSPNDKLLGEIGGAQGTTYTLEAGKDYKAEYFNNTNQGTAVVIITGLKNPDRTGNMEALANVIAGIKSMTSFKITAHTGQLTYPAATKTVEYEYNTTVNHELDAHGGDGTITYKSSDTDVADVTNSGVVTIKNAGTTRITAHMANDGNYTEASAYYDLTVKPCSLKNAKAGGEVTATVAGTSFPYIGEAYKPAVVVKDNGRTLQEGKHYTLAYANNTNQGTATITIAGTGNYSDAAADNVVLTFTITTITPDLTFDTSAARLAKGQKLTRRATTDYGTVAYSATPAGVVTVSTDGVVTANATTNGENADPVNVTITATVAAGPNNNWKAVSKSYTLTVVESDWLYRYAAGAVQSWTCPIDGVWELEAMGAQGASAGGFNGGRGADIAGQVKLKQGQVLYIYVGQGGVVGGSGYTYNGGGYGSNANGGGGATDFALKSAAWDSNDHLYSRILVAGGGGGCLNSSSPLLIGVGGSGGGEGDGSRADYTGETGPGGTLPGQGGTLSAGGALTTKDSNNNTGSGGVAGSYGKGGYYTGSLNAGAGGGGWFGGASGQMSGSVTTGSGGGGSSFIYNAANLQTATAGGFTYNLQTPALSSTNFITASNLEITPTILVTGGSPDANGQARITYKSAE